MSANGDRKKKKKWKRRRRKGKRTSRETDRWKTEVESHGNDLFPWSRGSHRTRGVLVSAYRVFRKCKPGTTRLHSAPEAPDGKSRGGLESIKCLVNKVTHFEIYECAPALTALNALVLGILETGSSDHLADFPRGTTSTISRQPEFGKCTLVIGKSLSPPPPPPPRCVDWTLENRRGNERYI